jgi:hypothetical protein
MGYTPTVTTVYRIELLNTAQLVWDGQRYVPNSSGIVVSTHYSRAAAEAELYARRRRNPAAKPAGIFVRGEVLPVHRRIGKEV